MAINGTQAFKTVVVGLIINLMMAILTINDAMAGPLQEQIAAERKYTRELMQRIAEPMNKLPGIGPQTSAEHGAFAYLPRGLDDAVRQNADAVNAIVLALGPDKPMTLEAIIDFRKMLMESGALDAMFIGYYLHYAAAVQKSISRGDSGIDIPNLTYEGDADHRPVLKTGTPMNVSGAKHRLDTIVALRLPEVKVRFQLGTLTLESASVRTDMAEIEGRISQKATEVQDLERDIVRQGEELADAVAKFQPAAEDERKKLAKRIADLGDDVVQIENETRYSAITIRTLATSFEFREEQREKTKIALAQARAELGDLRKEASEIRARAFPPFKSLRTDHALLEATDSLIDEVTKLDKSIAELLGHSKELTRQRGLMIDKIKELADNADKAHSVLSATAQSSYVAQALAQAVSQIADAAISSKGNPWAFSGLALTQSFLNLTFSWPTFYDAQIKDNDVVVIDRSSFPKTAAKAAGGTTSSGLIVEFIEATGRISASQSDRIFVDAAELLALRRVVGNSITSVVAKTGIGNPTSSFLLGLAMSLVTEEAKKKIAVEMQRPELIAYAAAQSTLANAVIELGNMGNVEDADAKALAKLNNMRAALVRGFGQIPADRSLRMPEILARKNDAFEIDVGYQLTVKFDGDMPDFDFLLNDVALKAGDQPGAFIVNTDLIDKLALGASPILNIRLVLK